MREDETGVDTIFGALILILVCLIASSALIVMDTSSENGVQDIGDLERKFDCILTSTLELEYFVGGNVIKRSVSMEKYAIEMLNCGLEDATQSSKNVSDGISSLVDFYFFGFDGWSLRLNCSHPGSIVLATRGQASVDGGNTYVLSRPLIGTDGGEASLDFLICQ